MSSSACQERPAGSFTVGLGYSQVQGLIFSLSVQQENFIGSGKRLGLGISHSSIISSLNLYLRQSLLDR